MRRHNTTTVVASSIGGGGTSAPALPHLLYYVPAHFFHIMVPAHFSNRWQNHERKNTCAKFEHNITNAELGILYSGNFLEIIGWEILGNYMLGNSWKPYAGKLGWMPAAF